MTKFWEDENITYYHLYETLKQNGDMGRMAEFIPELLKQNPKLIPYVINRLDSCFGKHIVYLVVTNYGIKIGYTKNTIETRFGESRYSGSTNFEIIEILRQEEFQAKGAVEFESKIKELCKSYLIQTDMVMPGKGEIFDIKFKTQVLNIFDLHKNEYKNIIGIKPPN